MKIIMILGNIIGKTTTHDFRFLVKGDAKKFQYVQVPFNNKYVLAQIVEIEKDIDKTIAFCNILGYRDGKLEHLRYPLEPNTEVLVASEDFIKETLGLKEDKNSAYIGKLDGYDNIKIYLDLNKLLTKHVNILAKSGSGKSYSSSVVIEEILEKDIPLLIIDPHGEYSSLKYKNEKDKELLKKFDVNSKSYKSKIQEYSPNIEDNPECIPLKLNKHNISTSELIHLLPAKLSNSQQAILYSVLKNIDKIDFNQLILELELEENNLKYTLINILKYLEKLNLFSDAPTSLQELIQPGKCSIINLKGVSLELQEVVVYKLMKDLFEERKKANVPPFFVVIEEAHSFCLSGDTQISTKKGNIAINKLKKNDLVKTFNFERNLIEYKNPSKIFRKRIAEVYSINTKSGNIIKSTKDHPFFTEKGFVCVSGLKKVGIPLENDYKKNKDLVIARLIGHLFGDGWLNTNEGVGFSGHYEDLLKIKEDLDILGFSSSKIHFKPSISKINSLDYGKLSVKGSGHSMSSSRKCFRFFKNYKIPIGRKVLQKYKIPKFIMKGSLDIKSEFLGALMGSDGYAIRIKNKNADAVRISFSKIKDLDKNAKEFAKQIIKIFNDLEISANYYIRAGNIRKSDGLKTKKYIINISNENNNFLNFVSNVGFRYCKQKEIIAKKAMYYYKHKIEIIKNKENLRKKVIKVRKKTGYGKIKLSKIFKLDSSLIRGWIYECKHTPQSKSAGLGRIFFPKFKEWCKEYTDEFFIFDTIKEIKYLGKEKVYNFSIDNNNFFSNNVLTHNCPERTFGESKSSQILRQIASEGRKFGLGLCVVSQRPSRLDKSVISQSTTQIILKVTNPYDIKAIANSVENITSETENEIKNIPVGTAIVTGVIDLPLFVNIRPRRTKHGGEAVDMLQISKKVEENFIDDKSSDKELLLVIKQKISIEDMKTMGEDVKVNLAPCLYINCGEFNLLFNLNNGELIDNIESGSGKKILLKLDLSPQQRKIFDVALNIKEFKAADLFSKSGVQFSEIYDIISILVNKNYFVKINDKFKISPNLVLNFSEFAVYEKPDYYRIDYNSKLEKNFNSEEIKNFLSNFIKIKSSKECWLELYC